MDLIQRVGGYEEKFPSLFEATDYRQLSIVNSYPYYLVASATWIALEPSPDTASGNCSLNVGKQ
ncbi:MAG: hypothetical protein QOF62_1449 [Pyrinomonadaceae bacterium]|jgi:hypothetical protein|nr:hypothetical protein [Pyrinomonadaceae bacterium]